MFKKIFVYILIASFALSLAYSYASAADDDKFLEKVERQAFDYFINETNKGTGLTLNTTEHGSPATNAASGFTLSAMVIGAERGWISRDTAYNICLKILTTFKNMESFDGFTYHYFDANNRSRVWTSEVSCIDTSLFIAGVITVGEYFKGTQVGALADELFKKVNWKWFLNNERCLQMSWKPEKGFSGRIDSFSEGIICYILAMGSTTFSIPKECWDSFTRPVSQYGGYKLIYVSDGGLFQYLFPLVWLDLRDKHDKYADYWQNAIKAAKANMKYCLDNSESFATYREGFWGLSASLSPDGYRNFGARPGRNKHNGTVAPYAVAGSIPLIPKLAIASYEFMYDRVSAVRKRYGLTDAFNIDRKWASEYYIAIDQGLALLMIENYRTGLIWKYFMRNDYVKRGLAAAGFVPGKLDEPSALASCTGNPNDRIIVKRLSKKITIDGDDSDWVNSGYTEVFLTAKDNRNIEMTIGAVKNDADLSATFYLGRDDKNLYIMGRIKDDSLVNTETKDMIYKDDCVEIFFDTNNDGYYFDRNPYDYQLGIAPYGPEKKPQVWAWGYAQKVPENISYAAKLTKDGYNVEVKIPFEAINNFKPDKNRCVGFTIAVHDRDTDGTTKKLTWSIDSASQPGKIILGIMQFED